jgi:adenylate cyclase, class 2
MNIEKEVKFLVDEDFLNKVLKNPKFKKEIDCFQKTVRRDTGNSDLEKKGISLRTRSDVKNVVTLKRKIKTKNKSEIFEREEYETEVGDIKVMEDILEILGFDSVRIMEKHRIQGEFDDVTIVFDRLPFGLYMEIEGEEDQIKGVCDELKIDFSKRITKTYWELWDDDENGGKKDIVFD